MSDSGGHPTTPYFREQVLRKRPYLRLDWFVEIIKNPIAKEIQANGRIRFWGLVPELSRHVRVVTLEDGWTIHNAFPDRGFEKGEEEG